MDNKLSSFKSFDFTDYCINGGDEGGGEKIPQCDEMIEYIVYKINFYKDKVHLLTPPQQMFDNFIYHMCIQEGQGVSTLEDVIRLRNNSQQFLNSSSSNNHQMKTTTEEAAEKETVGMLNGLKYILNMYEEMNRQEPLVTVDFLLELHKVLMTGILKDAGCISTNKRYAWYSDGTKMFYPDPELIYDTLLNLCDKINAQTVYLFNAAKTAINKELLIEIIFFLANSYISIISLHPFGDGNGRWTRLVFYYLHHIISPLPVSIYNVFNANDKKAYIDALCSGRNAQKHNSKPLDLATIILLCEYYTWIEYDKLTTCYVN